jgi:hypothetical protein
VIVTRASKGAPLTRTELDNNFTNIDNATISVTGDSGTITNSLNDSFQISGGVATTSKVVSNALIIDLDDTTVTAGSYTYASITVDAQGRITAASNGTVFDPASPGAIGGTTRAAGSFTTVSANSGLNFATATPASDCSVTINSAQVNLGNQTASATKGNLTMSNISAGTLNGVIIGGSVPLAGKFTNLSWTGYTTETVYNFGNSGATTITPDAANGTIQTITATGNFTLNAFANPVAGQTITFIIQQDGTGSRTMTSNMKFASGYKTLSTTTATTDILTVLYAGAAGYYASLAKGFA